jgi:hypothetical protein
VRSAAPDRSDKTIRRVRRKTGEQPFNHHDHRYHHHHNDHDHDHTTSTATTIAITILAPLVWTTQPVDDCPPEDPQTDNCTTK